MKKIIVITGGSDGFGEASANILANENDVILLARNEERLKKISKKLGCSYYVCDVTNYIQMENVVEQIIEKFGRIDVLINNAGIIVEGLLQDNKSEDIINTINVNTTGTILMTKVVLPTMIKQNSGLIINVISQGGLKARAERSVYNASKWAITGFNKSLQLEVSKNNIRITGFFPGKLNTNMFEKIGLHKDMEDALGVEKVAQALKFVVDADDEVLIPEFGMINIKRK